MSDKQPTVKVTPDFKAGETVIHKGTGDELKVEAVTPEGNLRCQGVAGLIVPTAVEKKV